MSNHVVDYSLLTEIWLFPPLLPSQGDLPILPDSHLSKQNVADKARSRQETNETLVYEVTVHSEDRISKVIGVQRRLWREARKVRLNKFAAIFGDLRVLTRLKKCAQFNFKESWRK